MAATDQSASEREWRDVDDEIEHARRDYVERVRADADKAELVGSWLRLCSAERKRAALPTPGE